MTRPFPSFGQVSVPLLCMLLAAGQGCGSTNTAASACVKGQTFKNKVGRWGQG